MFLHGTGSAAALAWSSTAHQFADHYAVYAPDLPAFGRSTLSWEFFNAATCANLEEMYADWLAHYLDAVGLQKPVVVAHSIGAFFAIHFAKKYPTKVSKLILVDPAGLLPTLGAKGFYFGWLFKLGFPTRQARFFGKVLSAFPKTTKTRYWHQLNASPTAFGDHVVAKFITTTWSSVYWNRPALRSLLTADVPFAFVYGELDDLMPSTQGDTIVEACMEDPIALVGLVSGAWHMPFHIDNGRPFVDRVLRAIEVARLPQPSGPLLSYLQQDPEIFASSWNVCATTRTVEQLHAALKKQKGLS